MADFFFLDHIYLAKFDAWLFIWWGLAFYGFMSWFAAIETQIIVHAVLSFSRSESSLSLEFPFALGGIYLCVRRFLQNNFSNPSIWMTMRSLGSAERSLGTPVKTPVSIEISGFINKHG
jgi:hypothetical protein